MPKDYTQQRANQAITIAGKAQKILNSLERQNTQNIRDLQKLRNQHLAVEKTINHLENEMGWIADNQKALKSAAKKGERSDAYINQLRQRIATSLREIKTLGSYLHAIGEKHKTEALTKANEQDRLNDVEKLVKQLNLLQHALHSQLAAKKIISGKNRPKVKV